MKMELLLIIDDISSAFLLAEQNGWMSDLKSLLSPEADAEHWNRLAKYLEKELKFEESGDSFVHSGQYHEAIAAYIKAGPSTLNKCIDIIHKTDKTLAKPLLDWILTLDNFSLETKDVILIFDLQIAVGQQDTAITTITKRANAAQVGRLYLHICLIQVYAD